MSTADWEQPRESWTRVSGDFSVEISRHVVEERPERDEGPNRWCVYAYIFDSHPLFKKLDGTCNPRQAVFDEMPFHGGCNYLTGIFADSWRNDGPRIRSWKAGCDYSHIHDRRFSFCETLEEASQVVRDADELFAWLSAVSKGETPAPAQTEVSPMQALQLIAKAARESES